MAFLVTELIVKRFQIEWTIENVKSIKKNQGESVDSPEFEIEMGGDKMRWVIKFYPFGSNNEEKNHISIHPVLVAAECEIVVRHEFIIVNAQRIHMHESVYYDPQQSSQGLIYVLEKSKILREDLLPSLSDDKLRVIYNLKISKNNQDPTYSLSASNLQSSIANDLYRAKSEGKFSDFTFTVGGTDFEAHKFILAARSPVFSSMFKHNLSETATNRVEISDMEPEVFEQFLKYVYTGDADVEDMAEELLAAAEKYDMQDLKSLCEYVLEKNTTVENCLETLAIGDLYSTKNLKRRTMDFFLAYADKFDSPMNRLSEKKLSHACLTELEAMLNQRKTSKDNPTGEFTFEWTIKNISFSFEKSCITSPLFNTNDGGKERWAIQLYPKDKTKNNEYYTSIYLKLVASYCEKVKTSVNFTLKNCYRKEITKFASPSFLLNTKESSTIGIKNLVTSENIFRNLGTQDDLSIVCTIITY